MPNQLKGNKMSLVTRNTYSIDTTNKTQTAGKALAVTGGAGAVVYLLAALLPFVGVLGTSVVLAIAGLLLIAKR